MRLEAKNLKIGYKNPEKIVLDNINLEFNGADLIAVIGVNGIGKSTLLKSFGGIIPTLGGDFFIDNKSIRKYNQKELAKKISIVLTKQPQPQNLSISDFVALGRQPYTNWLGINSDNDKKKVNEAIKQVELFDLRNDRLVNLSDGQLQKALIARAIAQDTDIILLDEPTSHLDLYYKALIFKLLKKISSNAKKAVLFATHEMNLSLQICDQIILIKDNQIIKQTPEKLIESGILTNLFPNDSILFDNKTGQFNINP